MLYKNLSFAILVGGLISCSHGLIAFKNQTAWSNWREIPDIIGCIPDFKDKAQGSVSVDDISKKYEDLITQAAFYDVDMLFSNSFRNLAYKDREITFGSDTITLTNGHLIALVQLLIDAVQGKIGEIDPVVITTQKFRYVIDVQRKSYPNNELYYFFVRKCDLPGTASALRDKTEDELLDAVYFMPQKSASKRKIARIAAGATGGIVGVAAGAVAGAFFTIPVVTASLYDESGISSDVRSGRLQGYIGGIVMAPAAVAGSALGVSVGALAGTVYGAKEGAQVSADAADAAAQYLTSVSESSLGLSKEDKTALANLVLGNGQSYSKTFTKDYGSTTYNYRTTFTASGDTVYVTTVYVKGKPDPSYKSYLTA